MTEGSWAHPEEGEGEGEGQVVDAERHRLPLPGAVHDHLAARQREAASVPPATLDQAFFKGSVSS
jgi:hypothetical protein